MARQFNGTSSDFLESASAIDLSGTDRISMQAWLWWDTFGIDNKSLSGHGYPSTVPRWGVVPNSSSGFFRAALVGNVGTNLRDYTRPTEDAWHHYVFLFNLAGTSAGLEVLAFYIDGVVGGTIGGSSNNTNTAFSNVILYLMSQTATTLFGAGQLAEVAIWTGINLSSTDVNDLYNNGLGALATSVQSGNLAHYWRIRGLESPEPATVGSIALTVHGTAFVDHPFSDPAPPDPSPFAVGIGV